MENIKYTAKWESLSFGSNKTNTEEVMKHISKEEAEKLIEIWSKKYDYGSGRIIKE